MTGSRIVALLTAAALAAGLSACGGEDDGEPIPPGKARQLDRQLDRVETQIADGLCDEALDSINTARATVDGLEDDGVGSDVQDALGDGVDNLRSLAALECDPEEAETTPETVPETTPPPPTETMPPPTTETTPPPTQTEPPSPPDEGPPDEGDGGAQFDPNADLPPGQQRKLEDDD